MFAGETNVGNDGIKLRKIWKNVKNCGYDEGGNGG